MSAELADFGWQRAESVVGEVKPRERRQLADFGWQRAESVAGGPKLLECCAFANFGRQRSEIKIAEIEFPAQLPL